MFGRGFNGSERMDEKTEETCDGSGREVIIVSYNYRHVSSWKLSEQFLGIVFFEGRKMVSEDWLYMCFEIMGKESCLDSPQLRSS